MATKLGDLVIAIAADLAPLKSGIGQASSLLGGFATGVTKIAAGFALGGALADALRIPPDLVQDSVKLAAGWEKASVQLGVLTGSADNAKFALDELNGFGVESGLGLSTSLAEAKKLLAAGVELKQLVPTMRVLSDLTMGDRELFGRASLAYGQARSAGVL